MAEDSRTFKLKAPLRSLRSLNSDSLLTVAANQLNTACQTTTTHQLGTAC